MARRIKTGGRQHGTPNKLTRELREIINDFLQDNIENVKKDFKSLEPKDRVKIYIELLNYGLPKLQAIQAEVSVEEEQNRIRQLFEPVKEAAELNRLKKIIAKQGLT